MNPHFDPPSAAGSAPAQRWRGRSRAGTAVGALLVVLAGCASSATPPPPRTSTELSTVVRTSPPTATFTPEPASSVRPLPPGARPGAGEKDGRCPYLKPGLNIATTDQPNVADLEGDRVYRMTLLTRYRPVGCRFYFYAPPYEAVADIRPRTFATATEAYNAMVLTARAGRNQIPERNFVGGLTGICFQTRYFGPDGRRDWAFVFAKGRTMVVVHTQRSDTSRNALYLGRAIAGKF